MLKITAKELLSALSINFKQNRDKYYFDNLAKGAVQLVF